MVSLGAIDKSTTTKISILRKYLVFEKIINICKIKSLYVLNDQDSVCSFFQINDAFFGKEEQFKKKGYVFKTLCLVLDFLHILTPISEINDKMKSYSSY